MKKRKICSLFLCLAMALSMASCGKSDKSKDDKEQITTEASTNGSDDTTASQAETSTEATTEKPTTDVTKLEYKDLDVEEILSQMTTRDKVEQMMVISYRVWKEIPETDDSAGSTTAENQDVDIPEVDVTELNDVIREDLKTHHYGGTLLFAENYRDAEQTLKLVADMQQTNLEGGGIPLIVATDQEGGNVYRIEFGTAGPGNMALAATGDPENARKMANIYGTELSLLGINADYAPVLDVNNNPNNPVIGVRSFSDSPEIVSEYGSKYIEGLHETGTIVTLKHFPGHGNTDTDSHTGFPVINSSLDDLRACELIPFQKAIDAGADMIMTAHIQYPQIEKETYTSKSTGEKVYLPATMSHTILTDLLRDEMGFEGVVITDALDMAAINDNFSDEDIMLLAINAGADMIMLPIIMDTNQFKRDLEMIETAIRLVEEGKIDIETIDESVRRILTLKKNHGLLDKTDFTVTDDMINAAESGIGCKENRDTEWDLAVKSLTLLKNDGDVFPIKLEDGQKALVLFGDCCASRVATGELVKKRLVESGTIKDESAITVMVHSTDNEEDCLKAADEADYVILVHRIYDASCMDPNTEDGISSAVFDKIITARHESGKKVILLSIQLPYDAARFPDADAILLTYNSAYMREVPPESGEGSAYTPNLAAALCECFGSGEINGKLPVNIMKLDDNYSFTDEILYERNLDK